MIQLRTERLSLRFLNESDWPMFLQLQLCELTNRYIRPPMPEDQIRQAFESRMPPWHFEAGKWLTLVIEDLQGHFVGLTGFRCIDAEYRDVEVGYMLTPTEQGKGFATESLKQIIYWGITEYQIHKFIAYCDTQNVASQRVLLKSGFTQEGLLKEHTKNGDNWMDDCVFGLLSRTYNVDAN